MLQLREEKMAEKTNPHQSLYPFDYWNMFMLSINNLWSCTWSENVHIYVVLFSQRIPRCFINYMWMILIQCPWCSTYTKSSSWWPKSPTPPPHHWIIKHFYQVTIFCLWKIIYIKKSATYTICLLTYAASLLPTSLPPLTWKVNSIRFKTKSNCIGK